jgi:hypothetical protein
MCEKLESRARIAFLFWFFVQERVSEFAGSGHVIVLAFS